MEQNRTLYAFIDESGNMDFWESGTKYFVLAAVTTLSPITSSSALQSLKYRFLSENHGGQDFQHFHASEDRQFVRDAVVSELENLKSVSVDWIWAEKRLTPADFRKRERFYSLLGLAISRHLLVRWKEGPYEKIVIVFDKALTKKEQDAFYAEVKPQLKAVKKPYAIYFHQTVSDFNGQIADYFAWAKYVSLERSEFRPLKRLEGIPNFEFNVFEP